MTDKRIIEEMAKLDVWEKLDEPHNGMRWTDGRGGWRLFPPNYLEDHNACQRVIDGMGKKTYWEYVHIMISFSSGGVYHALKATPREKCEAILKAHGKWVEED